MPGHMVLYRGSLKSCNYHCSYCPFSKREMGGRELEKDKMHWQSFVDAYVRHAKERDIRALMAVPYGEALIHPWYWEGLAHISALPWTDAAGAQTNLGFSLEEMLSVFLKANGVPEKLRIWATFHPQMTTAADFAKKCESLLQAGVKVCAGAVGVPENLEVLKALRARLPDEIYFWLNRMDGLRRPYTPMEEAAFLKLDPYFYRELAPPAADCSKCGERLMAEAGGRLRSCTLSRTFPAAEWESFLAAPGQNDARQQWRLSPVCARKRCFCFLAYGGREDFMNQALFGPYPLFRIPRRPKAVFLDIAGTLCQADGTLPKETRAGLKALWKEHTALFFATTMPYHEAARRCRSIRALFRGGIFAAGAHLLLDNCGKRRECFYYFGTSLSAGLRQYLKPFERQLRFRLLEYQNGGGSYKFTLHRASKRAWTNEEARAVFDGLPPSAKAAVRYFIEGNCMQIVAAGADKENGVRQICRWLGIQPEDTFAAGDSAQDAGMLALCGKK